MKYLLFAGLCYKIANEVSDWFGAMKTCNEMVKNVNGNFVGGIAKVNSEQENEFLKGKLTILRY